VGSYEAALTCPLNPVQLPLRVAVAGKANSNQYPKEHMNNIPKFNVTQVKSPSPF
jgi:hypothetical protein